MRKVLTSILIIISVVILNNASIYAIESENNNSLSFHKSTVGGLDYTFAQTIEDNTLAKLIANSLGKSINDTISQNDINRFVTLSTSNKEITSMSGLEYFINLKSIIMDNNLITNIPNSITNLTNLTELSLEKNKIVEIPDSIGSLVKLNFIDMRSNQINEIPNSITKLSKLRILYLNNNKISEIPDNIDDLTELAYLLLANNNISNVPSSIGNLSNLNTLNLYGNHISSFPQTIKKLNNLSTFYIDSQKINLDPQYYNSLFKTTNIIKDNEDKYISPSMISNNGVYNNQDHTINWNQLNNEDQIINYSFTKQININNKYIDFTGTVFQPIMSTKDIQTVKVEVEDNISYNGKLLMPKISIYDDSNPLTLNTDYDLEYLNNTNAGKGEINVLGMNGYTGKKTIYFTIKKAVPIIS